MTSVNHFVICGNLTRDPERRQTGSGVVIAHYTIASDEVWYEDGVRKSRTDFVPVSTFGYQAESDLTHLRKGSMVTVSGRIRSWSRPAERKSGFNFEPDHVNYPRVPDAAPVPGNNRPAPQQQPAQRSESDEREDWLREYDDHS